MICAPVIRRGWYVLGSRRRLAVLYDKLLPPDLVRSVERVVYCRERTLCAER